MHVYSAHIRRGGLDPDRDIVLVKEGFCWPAAMFPPFWAIWLGMWASALALTAVFAVVVAVIGYFSLGGTAPLWLVGGFAVMAGLLGNDLRRAHLTRRGFSVEDVVIAANMAEAEHRFFDRHPVLASEVAAASGASVS